MYIAPHHIPAMFRMKLLIFRKLDLAISFEYHKCSFHSPIQSNALPQHIKISVSRDTIFEDSFAQVMEKKEMYAPGISDLFFNS